MIAKGAKVRQVVPVIEGVVDDRRFFPPYEAAALVSGGLAQRSPRAIAALTLLSGRLDVARTSTAMFAIGLFAAQGQQRCQLSMAQLLLLPI